MSPARTSRLLSCLLLLGMVPAAGLRAADSREALVAPRAWLADHLSDPKLVLLHLGEAPEYPAKHIPGARFARLEDVSAPMDHSAMKPTDLMLEMSSPASLRDQLQALGISNDSTVVVYYADRHAQPAATRMILTLAYAGLGERARLLDGGLAAWIGEKRPTTSEVPAVKRGTLAPLKLEPLVVDAAFVQANVGKTGVAVVDARDRVFYDGAMSGGSGGRGGDTKGHVPGALSVPFADMFDERGALRPAAELEAIFTKAGVKPGDTVVGYCHIGLQATAMLFAARTLGHPIRLYDGSMTDWLVRQLPLEKPKSGGGSRAADTRDSLLAPRSWVADHLNDPKLVLLHLGDEAEYKAKHLPGARFVTMADVSADRNSMKPGDPSLEMSDADRLRDQLQTLGISNDSTVVVYYGNDYYSPSTRVLLSLTYAGLGDHAKLLDGGMPAWIREGRPTTIDVPAARRGTLAPLKLEPVVVDAMFVQANLHTPGIAIVDARDRVFYDGTMGGGGRGSGDETKGHIPGSVSVPFGDVFDERGELRPAAELEAMFTKAGVKPNDTVVGYCHVGQQATVMLFAARSLGHQIRLYDGSMSDWLVRKLPLERPKGSRAR